jgi:hypothetical protein
MASFDITHENDSHIINALADKRTALFAKVWAEDGRDFTPDEQGELDVINNALLHGEPEDQTQAGAVLETAIEQFQLFRHGDPDIDLQALETALFKVLGVFARASDYRPSIFRTPALQ